MFTLGFPKVFLTDCLHQSVANLINLLSVSYLLKADFSEYEVGTKNTLFGTILCGFLFCII
jgi:hypothetical protein